MEVQLKPDISLQLFQRMIESNKIQEYMAAIPPTFLKTYVSLGKTRLITSCISYPSNFYDDHEYFTCMHSNEFVRSTLLELGSLYFEVWDYNGLSRKKAKKIKKKVGEMKELLEAEFKRTILEDLMYWSEYNKETKKNMANFVQAMKDIFEPGGKEFEQRRRMEESLERRLWVVYERFVEIKRQSAVESSLLTLPKLAGQLRRDITLEIALPDLGLCHLQMQSASIKMRKAERRWIIWKMNQEQLEKFIFRKKVFACVAFLGGYLIIYYIIK